MVSFEGVSAIGVFLKGFFYMGRGEWWDVGQKICLQQKLNHLNIFITMLPVFVSIRKIVFGAPYNYCLSHDCNVVWQNLHNIWCIYYCEMWDTPCEKWDMLKWEVGHIVSAKIRSVNLKKIVQSWISDKKKNVKSMKTFQFNCKFL